MTSRDFCYWLQGYIEIAQSGDPGAMPSLTYDQMRCVRAHLALVFKHEIDPSFGDAKLQEALNKLHEAGPPHGAPGLELDREPIRC